jgi:hypothetical protein
VGIGRTDAVCFKLDMIYVGVVGVIWAQWPYCYGHNIVPRGTGEVLGVRCYMLGVIC